jgi:peptide-methionine (R)-S-oxide reductase
MSDKIQKSDSEWRDELSPDQYQVLRCSATERPGTSPLLHEHREGKFLCAGCGEQLFDSNTKFESGSGWPSFYAARDGAIATETDRSLGMERTEALCAKCGGHLGHVFPDGPRPTGLRYCMNGLSLKFEPEKK